MKKEMNKYWLQNCHTYHPVTKRFSNDISFVKDFSIVKEQFFIFRYFLKDLIFLSGLFFVNFSAQYFHLIFKPNTNNINRAFGMIIAKNTHQ
nr:hypothetical protein [uncultured Carboxylicivirga sp.]